MVRKGQWLTAALACLLWSTGFAGTVLVPGPGGNIAVEVSSFQAKRFQDVIPQQYDFSCGSAAVASLLSFHYGNARTEQEVFANMLALSDQDKVGQEGFSMLDMKRYLESEGYQADGFRMSLTGLREQVRVPVIALVTLGGFRHFVVIKGISEQEVLVGDPARGLKACPASTFPTYARDCRRADSGQPERCDNPGNNVESADTLPGASIVPVVSMPTSRQRATAPASSGSAPDGACPWR